MPNKSKTAKGGKKKTLKWFVSRIGKIIYRKDTGNYGLKIKNITHAKALEMYQNDLDLYYQDTPFTS